MSDWDTYQQASSPDASQKARRYAELLAQRDVIDQEMSELEGEFLTQVSEEPGEHALVSGNWVVTVKRSERWSWDSDMLEQIYPNGEVSPDFVRKTTSIDKRKFQTLDEDERRVLLPALTRAPGQVKISVKESK